MKKINNSTELQQEIARLKAESQQRADGITAGLKGLRQDLKPVNLLFGALSSFGSGATRNAFSKSDSGIFSRILQRILLRAETKIENRTYEFVDTALDRLKSLVDRFVTHQAKRDERRNNP